MRQPDKEAFKLLPIVFPQEWMSPMNDNCIILNATVQLIIKLAGGYRLWRLFQSHTTIQKDYYRRWKKHCLK